MPGDQLIHIPFLLDFKNLRIDTTIVFVVSVLAAITVNAEGQAVMATMLGDTQKNSQNRFHFNPFLHLDISGSLCFLVAGFGWPRHVFINQENFKHPNFYLILSRFAGPFANLFLSGIAGSILWIMKAYGLEDQVFSIVMSVNLMTFVFNLLPFPPLAGASFFSPLFPKGKDRAGGVLLKACPYLLVAAFIGLRLSHSDFLNEFFHPIVQTVFKFLAG
jgi:Zn-dependent protease